ncbi:hypothetical protein E6C76_01450 [Pseudothauera nasutitermitis]|uniref:Uncharacterized protein n=1 Tax=Pseudothauera nasutitermitis TaxID=2565930 RepID=A0A4S4B468_9RHOO|nr:hypothetical protein [Pseudothauera nasutitermitis]THF67081.1 hypothetical protein E6C76_01450 [Pseudothauera nasutitermitis]
MIFADLQHSERYSDIHAELVGFVSSRFSEVKSGLQGDSWIWIFDGEEKVAIDTFSSMTHQVKSNKPGAHVQQVLDILQSRYKLLVYEEPELEGFEDV